MAITLLLLFSARVSAAQEAGLQPVLDSIRQAVGARGASAAVIFPDGRVWTGASGEAWDGHPVTTGTWFELGSITKTYTAALVLRLAAAGRLSVDDTLARWLPDFPGARGVTLRMLLNHTSGIFSVTDDRRYIPSLIQNPGRAWRAEDQFQFVGEPYFAPGAGWRYSNTGYLLLGLVIERVTGTTVGAALRRELLEPLGLSGTAFEAEDTLPGEKAHAFLDVNNDGTAEDLSGLMPRTAFLTAAWTAGAVSATAADAARWMRELHAGRVLTDAGRRQMQTLVDRPDGNRHGLGLLVVGRDTSLLSGHLGNSAGFSAAAFHSPHRGITVALLTNVNGVSMRPAAQALLSAAAR